MDIKNEQMVVAQFLSHKLPDNSLATQHSNGIFKIYDEKTIDVVNYLKQYMGNKVNLKLLKKKFNMNEKNMSFLIDSGLLQVIKSKNFNVNKIYFFSKSSKISELVAYAFHDYSDFEVCKDYDDIFNKVKKNKRDFFFIFLESYNKETSQEIRGIFKENVNTLSMISYIYNNNLYIDSLYSQKWKSPCHLCNLGLIEAEHRIGIGDRVTYQQIIDEFFSEDNNFAVEMKLEPRHELSISNQICNRIEKLITYRDNNIADQEDFSKGIYYDISSQKAYASTTHHWELCDCYD